MKKNYKYGAWYFHALKKMFLVMRMIFIISLICVMQAFALDSYTQNVKVSLVVKEMKLEDILLRIENQSKYRFAYNKNEINVNKKYSIKIKDAEIERLLNQLFSGVDISYTFIDRQIVLSSTKSSLIVQQQKKIYGKVTDSSGAPLPGVTVVVKGTAQGTVTSENGEYSLANVPDRATLLFSFVGMKRKEIAVGNATRIDVTLEEESVGIEEVVAVGYGVQKKANLTGSVSSVSSQTLVNRPTTNPTNLLQGRIAGLQVTQPSGQPGDDDATFQVRGLGSYGASSDPLILVDGVTSSTFTGRSIAIWSRSRR